MSDAGTLSKLADPEFLRHRARKARAAQGLTPDERLDWHIRSIVAAAPALSAEQRDRIASLLRPASSGEAAA